MNELLKNVLVTLIPAIIIAIFTSYFTVKLSLKQFYSQKWWEKKAEMYSKIVEHLSYLSIEYENIYNVYIDIDDNFRNDENFIAKCQESYNSLELLVTQGTFIVTNETAKILKNILELIDKYERRLAELQCICCTDGYSHETLINIISSIYSGMDEIRKQAKKDLNVN